MAETTRIVVIGSSNTDMVVRTPHIPRPGETILGGGLLMNPGGKGANQAVAAARLGAGVTLVARLGADVFGDESLANFEKEGIDASFVVRDQEQPSGVALIAVDDTAQNAIVVAAGANQFLAPADVDAAAEAIATADLVLLQFETPLATVAHAAALAGRAGARVLVNPAPAPAEPLAAEFFAAVDILTPNRIEAAMLLGRPPDDDALDPEEAALALRALGVGTVVLTLGEEGALAVANRGVVRAAAPRVEAVDTTAAGDCFTGALAVALAEGRPLPEALPFACAAAGLAVTRPGAQASMPSRAEVEAALARA